MKTIVIEVLGGVVQEVYTDEQKLNVVLLDWDNLDAERPHSECVQFHPESMASLPDETRRAVAPMLTVP